MKLKRRIQNLFGIEGLIDYSSGWLRIGRYWVGFWRGSLRLVPVIAGGGKSFTVQRAAWAFGDDDGSESAHSLDTEGAARTAQAPDVTFLIRIGIAETAGGSEVAGYALFAQKNGTGGYTEVTTSRTDGIIIANDTQSRADDESTTERLTAGGGTWVAGKYDDGQTEQGTTTITLSSNYSEVEFAIQIDSTYASDSDYWDLRVEFSDGTDLDTYNGTMPRVTASISATLTAESKTFSFTGNDALLKLGERLRVTFEGGDKSEFDSETNGTYLTVSGTAAMRGSYGLEVNLTGAGGGDTHGNITMTIGTNEIRYRIYVDPNTISMSAGSRCAFFVVRTDGTVGGVSTIGRFILRNNGGTMEAGHYHETDSGGSQTVLSAMPTSAFYIEAVIVRASSAVASDGYHQCWFDGVSQGSDTGLDNYDIFATINGIRIGGDDLSADVTGVIYLDDLILRDDTTEIGGGGYSMTAGQGSFTLTGQATGLLASRSLTAGQGSFTFTGQATGLAKTYTLVAAQGTFTLAGQAAGILHQFPALAAGQGSFTFTGYAAGLAKTVTMVADSTTFSYTGYDAGLTVARLLTGDQGTFTFTGNAAGITHTFPALVAGQGAFTITGYAAGLTRTRVLLAGQGSFTFTGYAAGLQKIGAYELIAEQGSFTLAGQAVGLLASRSLAAGQGSFTLTGYAAGLSKQITLTAEFGSFTIAGQAAGLTLSRLLTADQGTFALTGYAAGLSKIGAYLLLAASHAFTIAGQDTGLLYNRKITAGLGTFTLSGQAINFSRSYRIIAAQGSFTLTGFDATLAYSLVRIILEQDAYLIQVQEQDAYIVQQLEQDAIIIQDQEQTGILLGGQEL